MQRRIGDRLRRELAHQRVERAPVPQRAVARAPGRARDGGPAHRAPPARCSRAPRASVAPPSTRSTASVASRCASRIRAPAVERARRRSPAPKRRAGSELSPGRERAALIRRPPAGCSSASAQRAVAARDRRCHRRRPRAPFPERAPCGALVAGCARQTFTRSPDQSVAAPGVGIERAHLAIDGRCGRAPIDLGFALLDLRRVRRAGRRLRHRCAERPRGEPAQTATTSADAPASASLCSSVPAVSRAAMGTRTTSSIGPVSSPASICISVMPVSASPASSARWIGAAPRQRGSSEACTLMHPCRGQARIAGGRMRPYAATTSTSRSWARSGARASSVASVGG